MISQGSKDIPNDSNLGSFALAWKAKGPGVTSLVTILYSPKKTPGSLEKLVPSKEKTGVPQRNFGSLGGCFSCFPFSSLLALSSVLVESQALALFFVLPEDDPGVRRKRFVSASFLARFLSAWSTSSPLVYSPWQPLSWDLILCLCTILLLLLVL